jgi:hypothetical protein
VIIFLDSVPVGSLSFSISVTSDECRPSSIVNIGESPKTYKRAFLSYASADRVEVVKRAQVLRSAGVRFFQDVLSLEPGAHWQATIFREIEICDLFLLFWSHAAKTSEWVRKEYEYAIRIQSVASDGRPDIVPVVIEGPPLVLPPEELSHLQFGSYLNYVLAGTEKT